MYHALAILLVGAIMGHLSGWLIQTAGWCFLAGIIFFSGSLYLLAVTGITVLGAITPIGGVAFLLATQLEDGSWYIRSRAVPLQPYFEGGFPHGHDQWISAAATNWAALALALSNHSQNGKYQASSR